MLTKSLKDIVAGLLYRTGILSLLVRRRFRGRAVVLTYHRVLPPEELARTLSHPAIIVSPDIFARHIAVLNRYFTCLGLEEFSERMNSGNFSDGAYCLITFDDGWHDNHTFAFPILKQSRTPAVIFVPTDYVGSGKLFWQERLGHLLVRVCADPSSGVMQVLQRHGWSQLPGLPAAQRIQAIRSAVRALKQSDYADIDRVIADLESVLGTPIEDVEPDTYLNLEQMREMMRHGVTFQSHACSHRVLPRLPEQDIDREFAVSRRWLHEHLGVTAAAVAYPNGDHSPAVQRLAAANGYRFGFTTVTGCADPTADRFTLRRINISNAAAGSEARFLFTLLLAS